MFNINNKIWYNKYKKYISKSEVLGMTSSTELAFLQYYAKEKYDGIGEIVDLGCWLGATTISLAKGLISNNRVDNKKRIHAFDLFFWVPSLDPHVNGTKYDNKFKPGDDYKWLFKEHIKRFEPLIVTRGNIIIDGWDGRMVELMFIDAMKNKNVTQAIIKSFYPFLIPEKSFVVYQDFDHYMTPWVHLVIYHFRKYFKYLHDLPESGSCVFKLKKNIPKELINTDIAKIEDKIADKAFKYSIKLACKQKKPNIAASHIMYYYYQNNNKKMLNLYNYYILKGYRKNSDLQYIMKLLNE